MKPSTGRIVHYVPAVTSVLECEAAIVTAVYPGGTVVLTVLTPSSVIIGLSVQQDEDGKAPGTWHWPERVPE